jgi:hypothetical protein
LDTERMTGLIAARDPQYSDLEVTLALMDLVRDDFLSPGRDAVQTAVPGSHVLEVVLDQKGGGGQRWMASAS